LLELGAHPGERVEEVVAASWRGVGGLLAGGVAERGVGG